MAGITREDRAMNWNFIIGLIVVVYIGLWIADIVTATTEARKLMMREIVETTAVATVVGSFVWWLL